MRSEVYFYEDGKDIPEGYQYDCENDEVYEYRNPYNGKVIHIAKNPPTYVKAIPIPDNATNGDVIKAMFPDFEYVERGVLGDNKRWILSKRVFNRLVERTV